MQSIKKYIFAGLLVWIPIVVTVFVFSWGVGVIDGIFSYILRLARGILPAASVDFIENIQNIPVFGTLVILCVVWLTGLFAANVVGQWWFNQWNALLTRIPIVKSIYSTVKQVSDTIFSDKGNGFKEAVLVHYPTTESWTIGFLTGQAMHYPELGKDMVTIFIVSTPNPTSGFLILIEPHKVLPLHMSVDQALKYIVSLGVAPPPAANKNVALPPVPGLPSSSHVESSTRK